MLMQSVKEFYNENQTHIIIGGATIVCLGGLINKFVFSKTNNKSKIEEQNEECLVTKDGDVVNYSLPHTKPGYDAIYFSGLPTGLNLRSFRAIYDLVFRLLFRLERKKVNFLNARNKDLKFHDCGFELLNYKENFDPSGWDLKENQKQFEEEMEKIILEKYPGAKMGKWLSCLFRGGDGENPPAIDGPHLDTHPDVDRATEFSYAKDGEQKSKYQSENDDDETLQYILKKAKKWKMLGIWKPIGMNNPILDFPLAMMDKQTFDPSEDVVDFKQDMCHIDNGEVQYFKNLGGHLRHNSRQTWYYYPEMTCDETLLFTHVSKPDALANFHTSFKHPGAPKDIEFDTRRSVESRCMIYWPNDEDEEEILVQ